MELLYVTFNFILPGCWEYDSFAFEQPSNYDDIFIIQFPNYTNLYSIVKEFQIKNKVIFNKFLGTNSHGIFIASYFEFIIPNDTIKSLFLLKYS